MKRTLWMAIVAIGIAQIGCGGNSESTTAGSTTAAGTQSETAAGQTASAAPSGLASAAAPNPAPSALDAMVPMNSLNLANPTKPEEVVGAFLDGMRTGNAAVIEGLLSTRARKEIADKGLDIAPIGSPQARFEIGVAQLADPKDPNTVLVSSNWLEPGANGQPAGEYEVVWALIKEAAGWRICEMAVDTHQEGEEIQVVNFENLADVVPAGTPPAPGPAGAPQAEVPRTASNPNALPGIPNGPSAGPPPALPGNAPGAIPGSLPAVPAGNLPALPPSASGSGSLPALPAGPSGGSGSLPPLPPAGFGGGNSGQPSIR
ncbi:MAG: hypothetical protein MUF23_18890 [Pirellula sp.]|nr:hypothetical protein [Pirellula sp.]